MQAHFKQILDSAMMDWWDKLQANKRPVEPRQIQVEVQSFKIEEQTDVIPETPPDQIIK